MDQNNIQNVQRNRVFMIVAAVIVAVIVMGVCRDNMSGFQTEVKPSITVTGTGEVSSAPDTAVITFSVIETAKTVELAQKQATDRTNKALAYLKTAGIADKDIKTTNYSINPQYEYNKIVCVRAPCESSQTLVGYQASQSIEVKIRKTDQAGTVLAGLGSVGVQNIYGPQFTFDDDTKIQNDARAKAIADAKSKAEILAKQLGVHLVRITAFSENGGGYPMPYSAKAEMSSVGRGADAVVAPSLPTGENKVTSNVTISYEIR